MITYKEVAKNRDRYIDILLIADPEKSAVMEYINKGVLISAEKDDQCIGILHYTQKEEDVIELNNIGVVRSHLREGIGSDIIKHLVTKAKDKGIKSIYLGTGNSSIDNFVFYQKNGFEMDEIWKNYFVDRYKEEIYENGIRCKHMVRLKLEI